MSLIVVMVISFHQHVDDAEGVFMPLCGKVEIHHGRVEATMAQILLDTANVDACLQQMCGIGMAQGVDGYAFFEIKLYQDTS